MGERNHFPMQKLRVVFAFLALFAATATVNAQNFDTYARLVKELNLKAH